MIPDEKMEQFSQLMTSSRMVMALTGAGISADSGIPTFRGLQGLWEKYDIMEFAHIDAFRINPAKVLENVDRIGRNHCQVKTQPGPISPWPNSRPWACWIWW